MYYLLLPYLLPTVNLLPYLLPIENLRFSHTLSCVTGPGTVTKANKLLFLRVYKFSDVLKEREVLCLCLKERDAIQALARV